MLTNLYQVPSYEPSEAIKLLQAIANRSAFTTGLFKRLTWRCEKRRSATPVNCIHRSIANQGKGWALNGS